MHLDEYRSTAALVVAPSLTRLYRKHIFPPTVFLASMAIEHCQMRNIHEVVRMSNVRCSNERMCAELDSVEWNRDHFVRYDDQELCLEKGAKSMSVKLQQDEEVT